MASLISPTVARARAASMHSASRLPSPAAPSVSRRRASSQAAASRVARTRSRRAICWRRTSVLSIDSTSTWSGSAGWYLLTPTMTSSPRSTAAWRRAADSSMRSLGIPEATALVMPPSSSTSWISAHASSASAWVSAST